MHTAHLSVGGNDLSIETGKLAKQADGAVIVRYGETVILVTACYTPTQREGIDFLPLTVDFRENTYASGRIPGGFFEIGQGMAGPVLMMYANEEQKKRYLPPMAKGKEIWCQLFSEPGAGSDLAGLKTKSLSWQEGRGLAHITGPFRRQDFSPELSLTFIGDPNSQKEYP